MEAGGAWGSRWEVASLTGRGVCRAETGTEPLPGGSRQLGTGASLAHPTHCRNVTLVAGRDLGQNLTPRATDGHGDREPGSAPLRRRWHLLPFPPSGLELACALFVIPYFPNCCPGPGNKGARHGPQMSPAASFSDRLFQPPQLLCGFTFSDILGFGSTRYQALQTSASSKCHPRFHLGTAQLAVFPG